MGLVLLSIVMAAYMKASSIKIRKMGTAVNCIAMVICILDISHKTRNILKDHSTGLVYAQQPALKSLVLR